MFHAVKIGLSKYFQGFNMPADSICSIVRNKWPGVASGGSLLEVNKTGSEVYR
jgi:hypothetical protein